jgi:MoaA/NifB/PqqE/SkfB family radical SAM enzyme
VVKIADTYQMDSHKLFWHLDRVESWQRGERIAPLYLDMGITQTCNINCCYCYYAVPGNRTSAIIATPALIAFLQEAAAIGVRAVGFLGDGEPMLHPGVYDAIVAGRTAGLDMALATNGTILHSDRLEEFLSALSWIRFTVGAACSATYQSVMGGDARTFATVLDNIRRCVAVKQQRGLAVTIGIQMILIPETLDDILAFAAMGRELGVDYAVIKQCSSRLDNGAPLTEDEYDRHSGVLAQAESFSGNGYNMIVKWRKLANAGVKKYDRCFGCEFLPQISGNGDLYCCGAFFGNHDFRVGNINNESFKDLVFSERYREVMHRVRASVNVHRDCGNNCRQNEINEFLWMLEHVPAHVNFI